MNVISESTKHLLALSFLAGVGPATLKKVISLPGFGHLSIEGLAAESAPIARALNVSSAWELAQEAAERQIKDATLYDAKIISVLDSNYPKLLAATKDDPLLLFIRGALAESPDKSVAIIGTREPTAHGQVIAKRIAQFFAEENWSVVSGLAIGCDCIAHEATLDAGGHTVAVLAHGLQMIAPTRNKKLADRILAAGGALVSEYPFGREVQRQQYVKRDRTQAGLAQGVVMIQSDLVGGSLHASRAALDYQRWLAVPYPTERDLNHNEPKVQANLAIALGTTSEAASLLRCSENALNSILILNSRNDYLLMKEGVEGVVAYGSRSKMKTFAAHQEPQVDLIEVKAQYNGVLPIFGEGHQAKVESTKIATMPVMKISSLNFSHTVSWTDSFADSIGFTKAVSARLSNLHLLLNVLQLDFEAVRENGSQSSQCVLSFSVDNFVAQMAHAVELLLAVHMILSEPSRYSSLLEAEKFIGELADQSTIDDLYTRDKIVSMSRELSLELQNLRDSSTSRLIAASDSSCQIVVWTDDIFGRVGTLCVNFNHLADLVLVHGFVPLNLAAEQVPL